MVGIPEPNYWRKSSSALCLSAVLQSIPKSKIGCLRSPSLSSGEIAAWSPSKILSVCKQSVAFQTLDEKYLFLTVSPPLWVMDWHRCPSFLLRARSSLAETSKQGSNSCGWILQASKDEEWLLLPNRADVKYSYFFLDFVLVLGDEFSPLVGLGAFTTSNWKFFGLGTKSSTRNEIFCW